MPKYEIRPAGYGKRFLAYLIDLLIITTLQYCQYGVVYVAWAIASRYPDAPVVLSDPLRFLGDAASLAMLWGLMACVAVFLVQFSIYSAFFESSKLQATLGKRAFQLQVIHVNGVRISFTRALARGAMIFVGGLYDPVCMCAVFPMSICRFPFGIATIVSIFITEKRQGLHDLLTSTWVVETVEVQATGVNIDAQGDITIGGDVVGRDKTTASPKN